MQKGIILVAHKPIASSMVQAATAIFGSLSHCAAADIDSDICETEQFEQLENVFESVGTEEVVILLDIEGATPCNLIKKFCKNKKCIIISPLSFPLLFKMLSYRSLSFEELARKAEEIKPVICFPDVCE